MHYRVRNVFKTKLEKCYVGCVEAFSFQIAQNGVLQHNKNLLWWCHPINLFVLKKFISHVPKWKLAETKIQGWFHCYQLRWKHATEWMSNWEEKSLNRKKECAGRIGCVGPSGMLQCLCLSCRSRESSTSQMRRGRIEGRSSEAVTWS